MRNIFLLFILVISVKASATTWHVGSSQTYTMPSQVSTLVANGDTVLIDSGLYSGDVAKWSADDLVLRGLNGKARLHSGGTVYGGKAIWVISGDNAIVENIDFAEAACVDMNGAGIRQEGTDLTVRNCYFHDNENGILGGADPNCDILIEHCEFYNNGYGDGYSHNLYIGHINSLIFRYNYTHHTDVGHELKSRAANNYILYNRISDEATGTASRSIDLPNGGLAIIIGNVIEQGPNSQNSNIIGYGMEGTSNTSDTSLYIINNTIVNNKTTGSFIQVQNTTVFCRIKNNIFAGPGTVLSGTVTTIDSSNNWAGTIAAAGFINAGTYNYDILTTSPVINMGINPGMAGTYALTPTYEYKDTALSVARNVSGALDIGAYEYGDTTTYVNELIRTDDLSVYPNPSAGVFTVSVPANSNDSTVVLYDNLGRVVRTASVRDGKSIFNISDMPTGLYFIKTDNGYCERVVKW
jgi:hypothetical protein